MTAGRSLDQIVVVVTVLLSSASSNYFVDAVAENCYSLAASERVAGSDPEARTDLERNAWIL